MMKLNLQLFADITDIKGLEWTANEELICEELGEFDVAFDVIGEDRSFGSIELGEDYVRYIVEYGGDQGWTPYDASEKWLYDWKNLKFTGGTDTTDTSLIDWLIANGIFKQKKFITLDNLATFKGGADQVYTRKRELTQAEYDALPDTKLTDGILYCITDAEVVSPITYGTTDLIDGVSPLATGTIYCVYED